MKIKTISVKDKEKILEHLIKLPKEDCYMRFGQTMTPSALRAYVEKINFNRDLIFAIYSLKNEMEILAFGHIAFYSEADWPVAELGLSVNSKLRNMGLGRKMVEHSISLAKARGAKNLYVQTMTSNRPMHRLMQKFNAQILVEDDEATIYLPLNELDTHERISTKIINGCEVFEKIPSLAPKSIIIFVHGVDGDGWDFRRYFMPYFSKENVYTLALSLPNHGESRNSSPDIEEYIKTIRLAHERALSHNFNVPVMIVGHSMGGWLVQKYASASSLQLDTVALLSSVQRKSSNSFLPLPSPTQSKTGSLSAQSQLKKIRTPVLFMSEKRILPIQIEEEGETAFNYKAPPFSINPALNLMTGPEWQECAKIIKENIKYKGVLPVNVEARPEALEGAEFEMDFSSSRLELQMKTG